MGALVPSTREYNLSRSQKDVTVQDFNCRQMRVPALSPALRNKLHEGSGCNNNYGFVLSAGAKVEERRDEIPLRQDKKCDNLSRDLGKQLTHIVRVMVSYFYPFQINFELD